MRNNKIFVYLHAVAKLLASAFSAMARILWLVAGTMQTGPYVNR